MKTKSFARFNRSGEATLLLMEDFMANCLATSVCLCLLLGSCAVPRATTSLKTDPASAAVDDFEGTSASKKGKSPSLFGSLSSESSVQSSETQRNSPQAALSREISMKRVDENVWRTNMSAAVAFRTVTRVLSQNYVLQKVDKAGLTVSTEWDKFMVEKRMFRNRVTATVFPVSARSTEIVIKNDVQYYEGEKSANMNQAHWLPTADITDEVSRIVGVIGKQGSQLAQSSSANYSR